MKRTQLYMDEEIFQGLMVLSRQKNTTISQLVRQAVEKVYGKNKKRSDKIAVLDSVFGLWKSRKDLPSIEEYIRQSRKDTRLK